MGWVGVGTIGVGTDGVGTGGVGTGGVGTIGVGMLDGTIGAGMLDGTGVTQTMAFGIRFITIIGIILIIGVVSDIIFPTSQEIEILSMPTAIETQGTEIQV